MSQQQGRGPSGSDNDGIPLLGDDKRVAQLSSVLGPDMDSSRAKTIAIGVIVVGIIGAVGSALRPIIMRRYANSSKAISTAGGLGKGRLGTRTADEARRAMAADAARAHAAAEEDEDEDGAASDAVASSRGGGVAASAAPAADRYLPLFAKAGIPTPRAGYTVPAPLQAALDNLAAEEEQVRLLSLLHELAQYEDYHRQRHPTWYGAVTPELVAAVEADFRAQFDHEAAEGIFAGKAGGLLPRAELSSTSPFLPPSDKPSELK